MFTVGCLGFCVDFPSAQLWSKAHTCPFRHRSLYLRDNYLVISVCVFVCMFVCLLVCLIVRFLFVCLFAYLFACLVVCFIVCLFVCLFVNKITQKLLNIFSKNSVERWHVGRWLCGNRDHVTLHYVTVRWGCRTAVPCMSLFCSIFTTSSEVCVVQVRLVVNVCVRRRWRSQAETRRSSTTSCRPSSSPSHRTLTSVVLTTMRAVYCNQSCLWVCLCVGGYNSKLRAMLTKLGLWVKVVTVSSWLNFGRPTPPGRGSAAGRKFLALPYYSQRAVFASPPSAFFIALVVYRDAYRTLFIVQW